MRVIFGLERLLKVDLRTASAPVVFFGGFPCVLQVIRNLGDRLAFCKWIFYIFWMSRKEKLRTSGCPIAFGLDTFGDRWSLLIIRDMMLSGKKTYGEFLEAGEGISTNILADRLKHLESEGIIEKSQDPDNRRSFIYTLSAKGRDLAPIVLEIVCWSGKHDRRPFARKTVFEKIRNDRKGFEAKIRAG